jgi:hypothetical protein
MRAVVKITALVTLLTILEVKSLAQATVHAIAEVVYTLISVSFCPSSCIFLSCIEPS